MNIGNQRFVGTVGWRQNDQTYDAAAIIANPIEGLTAVYAFVWNVNRIFLHKNTALFFAVSAHRKLPDRVPYSMMRSVYVVGRAAQRYGPSHALKEQESFS